MVNNGVVENVLDRRDHSKTRAKRTSSFVRRNRRGNYGMAEQQPTSDQGAGSERDVAVHREPALGGDIPPLVADAGDAGRDRGRLGRVLPSCASAHEDALGWGVGGRLDADIVRDPDGVDGDGGGAHVQAVADQAGREGSVLRALDDGALLHASGFPREQVGQWLGARERASDVHLLVEGDVLADGSPAVHGATEEDHREPQHPAG
mmetsp:Transcript_2941/g.6629  ORF Transcript_2941/g.6629 Transcript_2941/m.6629 type:complete len:206 (+) Transcript_2941:509-1126(+)